MSVVANPAGEVAPAAQAAPEHVTPELAASLPYDELKARMRAEARDYVEPATPEQTPADNRGEQVVEGAVTPENAGPARDAQGHFTATPSTQVQTATDEAKLPATLDEAVRVLNSVRGNLNTATSERQALQRQLQEAQQEAARLKAEKEQVAIQAQHARFEDLASRLPADQQEIARAEYVRRLQQQAVTEFAGEVQQREQALVQREFQAAMADVPALYKDIARFVAEQHGAPVEDLVALVDSKHIADLIASANTPQALQQATIAFGQLLDYEGTLSAARASQAKAERREAKAAGAVRDMPNGVTAGGAQEDVVTRINRMSRDDFDKYRKQLLKAANA